VLCLFVDQNVKRLVIYSEEKLIGLLAPCHFQFLHQGRWNTPFHTTRQKLKHIQDANNKHFHTAMLKLQHIQDTAVRTDSGMVVAESSESVYLSCKRKSCVRGARQSHSDAFVSIILSVYHS
jgi:hypothetical protein